MVKVFAFDLDGTLTQHRTEIDDKNLAILKELSRTYKVLIVGAGSCERIYKQLRGLDVDIIGNYGMQSARALDGKLELLKNDCLPCKSHESVELRTQEIRNKYGYVDFCGDGVEFHASGCITLPLLGTKAKIEDKLRFDPTRKKRKVLYDDVCQSFFEYNVFIGGSSSFDMAPKPYNKYYALDRWCQENGYEKGEVVFVGDDYRLGGNDQSVYDSCFRFITIDDYTRLDEVLAPWLDLAVPDVQALLGVKNDCECKKVHTCTIERVVIRNGALNELEAMVEPYKNIVLVSDSNTWDACGKRVHELISSKVEYNLIFTSCNLLVPNEESVAVLDEKISASTDLIIGVGSGVINDLCKYVSFEKNLPYFIVATAPSMDGYASKGAAMLFNSMKITTNAGVPKAIIGDTEILKNAPLEMLKAGYGDMIGKFSCLNDWKLSALINGEELCEYIYKLTYDTVSSVSKMGNDIINRDEKSISYLMRALVIVGVAMAYMGNSRPASGSEHHLSHFFEVTGLLNNEYYFCHGIDVAYSTYVTSLLRQEITKLSKPKSKSFDYGDWEENIRRVYSTENSSEACDGIIELQNRLGWIFAKDVSVLEDKWDEICALLNSTKTPNEILEMLNSVSLSLDEFEKTYSQKKRCDAIKYAKDLKDRYSVLWLYNLLDF